MKKFSVWNKIDLHIHSIWSNKVKANDYEGSEYSAEQLLDVLSNNDNSINIFSITDHNCINANLYKDLENNIIKDKYKDIINYVIGIELDVNDPDIYAEVFHCLCFFESKDVDNIEKAINELFDNKALNMRNTKDVYPSVTKIFKMFAKHGIQNILLIPHFNNKSKGIPSDIAIENLNYLCFNAYEDSNNIKNVQKSLQIYKAAGYDNFPFAVFTDNHNLNIYPKDKNNNDNDIKCFILGNNREPFNALKTAFQEAKMRVSLSSIDGMRNIEYPEKYIDHICIGGIEYDLSPYQNTIVGKFGSGKSLLLKKIKDGSDNLENDEKYSEFYDRNEKSKVFIKTQPYNSLNEISESKFKMYEFIQQETYYYKNEFCLSDAKKLFNQLNINHIFDDGESFVFNKDSIKNSFSDIRELIVKSDGKNNLNYERAFDNQDYYSFNTSYSPSYVDATIRSLDKIYSSINDLDGMKIVDIPIFTDAEINDIKNVRDLVSKKDNILTLYKENDVESNLQCILNDYNNEFINNNAKDIKNKLIEEFGDFRKKLKMFANACYNFEGILTVEKYNEFKKEKTESIVENYGISWKYVPDKDYKSIIEMAIKSTNRKDSLFKSVINTLQSKVDKSFSNNSEFDILIDKYISYSNSLFTSNNIRYDILKNGNSLLKKSAGEKSSLFIEFIFDLLEKDLNNNNEVLLILDQPEDNIDNDNIFNQISSRIRNLKYCYNNFQSIIVTHNANVAITADSENIIIARENTSSGKKTFEYDIGCIENKDYIDNVCKILEGGKQAMEKRTIKYGINIIRKVEANGI